MIQCLKPNSFISFLTYSLSLSPTNLKWISTTITKVQSQSPINPFHCLHMLFSDKTNIRNPDYVVAVVSALKFCASHLTVSKGLQIHCLVLKSGLQLNTFIRNGLINMYTKCGFIDEAQSMFDPSSKLDPVSCNIMVAAYVKSSRMDDARQLFEIMPGKGCFSYTTMILGFSQNDCWSEAIDVFKDMRNAGVIPNEVTLASVISACSHLGGIWTCRMLHVLVIKMLLDGFVLISTNLLHMYCTCSSLQDAQNLFDEMPERNIFSWNVMLNGYSKAGLMELAREVFDKIPAKDVVSWHTLICGYVQVKWLSEALMMYQTMLHDGVRSTDTMLVHLISACSKSMAISEGQQIQSTIIKAGFDCYGFIQATIIHFYATCGRIDLACLQFEVGIKDHPASWNALISGFIKNGMTEQARQLFDGMTVRDVFSWSAMISGYTQSEKPKLALELFHEMVASGVHPNQVTMVSVFSAIASLGTLEEGKWAHEYMGKYSIPLNESLSAAIINMYAKCGGINTALEVFYQIRDKTSTVSPWNAILCGLAMHGNADLCLKLYFDLQRRHIKLNGITFIGALSACCHAGFVELGERIFKSIKSVHNIDPDIKHYGCMVDLLGRAGRLEEAEEMVRTMPMQADVVVWATLLAACRTHGNVEIGERAAESLAKLEPSHGGSRVLLSNIYSDARMWEDASLVRSAMRSHRINILPGCSGVV